MRIAQYIEWLETAEFGDEAACGCVRGIADCYDHDRRIAEVDEYLEWVAAQGSVHGSLVPA